MRSVFILLIIALVASVSVHANHDSFYTTTTAAPRTTAAPTTTIAPRTTAAPPTTTVAPPTTTVAPPTTTVTSLIIPPAFEIDIKVDSSNNFVFTFTTNATIDDNKYLTVNLGLSGSPCVGKTGDTATPLAWPSPIVGCPQGFRTCVSYTTTYTLAWLVSQSGQGCGFSTLEILATPTQPQSWRFSGKVEVTYWLPSRTWLIYSGMVEITQPKTMSGQTVLGVSIYPIYSGTTVPDSAQIVTSSLYECDQQQTQSRMYISTSSSLCLTQKVSSNLPFQYRIKSVEIRLCRPVPYSEVYDCTVPIQGPWSPAIAPLTNPTSTNLVPSTIVFGDAQTKQVNFWVTFPPTSVCVADCRIQSVLVLEVIATSIPGIYTGSADRRILTVVTQSTSQSDVVSYASNEIIVSDGPEAPANEAFSINFSSTTIAAMLALCITVV